MSLERELREAVGTLTPEEVAQARAYDAMRPILARMVTGKRVWTAEDMAKLSVEIFERTWTAGVRFGRGMV